MSLLLKKIESIELIIKQLAKKLTLIKDENSTLIKENNKLQFEVEKLQKKLELEIDDRDRTEEVRKKEIANIEKELDQCINEIDSSIDILQKEAKDE